MKKTIIFDLDGTLIDSDPIAISVINEIRKELNLRPLPISKIKPFLAIGSLVLIEKTISNVQSIKKNTYYLKRLREKILKRKVEENLLFPNVRKALDKLVKSNITLCICTNKGTLLVQKILFDLQISKYFKNVVADGDLDTRKPHENNYFASMKNIDSSKKECLIIGDSSVDVEFAKNSGVDFLAYKNKNNDNFIKKIGVPFFDDYKKFFEDGFI